jgi:hypothetical protein
MTRFQVRNRADGDVDIRALTSGEIMPETCPAAYWRAEGCDDPTCEWLLPDAPWVPAGALTREELNDIELKAEAATPGPWEWREGVGGDAGSFIDLFDETVCSFGYDEPYGGGSGQEPSEPDIAFIVTARAAMPALAAEVRRLRSVLSKVTSDLLAAKDIHKAVKRIDAALRGES